MFGFSQAPVLAALAQYIAQALRQTLLLTLQTDQQVALLAQFGGGWQAGKALQYTLLDGLELLLRCLVAVLELSQVFGGSGPLLVQLPAAPATRAQADEANQQSKPGQGAPRSFGWRGHDGRIGLRGRFDDLRGCFAHMSILCIRGAALHVRATPPEQPQRWRRDNL